MTLKKQLIIALLAVGLIPFLIMGITSYMSGSGAVENEAVSKLEVARDLKVHELESYIRQVEKTMVALSFHKKIDSILDTLNTQLREQKIGDSDRFSIEAAQVREIYRNNDSFFNGMLKRQGFMDIYIVSTSGHVMYSENKKTDLGENLKTGSLSNSGLAKAWKEAIETKKTAFADTTAYAPAGGTPAMFMAVNFFESDMSTLKGVMIAQMNIDAINTIMQSRSGMGKTGETYLVGADNLMRSDSFLDPVNHSVKASFSNPAMGSVKTEAVSNALAGKVETKIVIDYNGNPVLSSYKLVDFFGTKWALLAEIDESEVFAPIDNLRNTAIILGLVFLGVIIGIALFLGNRLSKPIIVAVEKISEANGQVVSASDQIASSATSLAEGASNQASSVEEVSATVEQSTAINTQNAQNAKEADILAKDANSAAAKGNEKVQNLMKSMEHISNSSNQISKIIKTIDEIAFQTNLLALNAAVEAARAGEHGLGFAVVADEVKNLAGRSAQAAKETETIIQSSIEQIKTGNEIASETNEAFAEILDKIKKTSNLIGEIAISAKEQSEGMNQIAQAMSTVDEVTQQNAATSEEAAAAAEELNAQANAMLESVAEIGAMVGVHVSLDRDSSHKETKKLIAKPKFIAKQEKKAISKVASKSKNNNEVFPLDEGDLKEF